LNIISKKWSQLWCLHDWEKGWEVDITPFEGFLYEFKCKVCDKKIYRTLSRAPISGIIPESDWAKYNKDPLYNVSPRIRKD